MLVLTHTPALIGIDNTKFGFHGSENIPHILDSEDTVTNQPLSVHTCSVGPLLRVHGESASSMRW